MRHARTDVREDGAKRIGVWRAITPRQHPVDVERLAVEHFDDIDHDGLTPNHDDHLHGVVLAHPVAPAPSLLEYLWTPWK